MLATADARGEAIVLRPGRRKWALVLVGSLVPTVLLALALASGVYLIPALGLVLFGAGVVFSVLHLVPGRAYLRIAPDGLVVRTPFNTQRWAWNDVEHFRGYEIYHRYHTSKHVGFDRRDLTPERQSFWHTVNRGMSGVDVALPDTYGMDHHELAELLNEARAHYATEHGISASERADRALEAAAARVRKDRVPAVTVVLAIACLALYVVEVDAYGAFPTAAELREAGGASMDALEDGDWWTLLYANLLHADPFHLFFNLIALALLGWLLEREIGWRRMACLCLAAALAAAVLGVLLAFGAVGVGVSGVIFGIAGWAVLRDTHRTRALGIVAWGTLPVGLIYTFLTPGTGIGAHVGGLLAGLAIGRAFERRAARCST
jgi:membrane associated rhomboid family serine protease